MPVSRRYRRRLLFPPGQLALAGLLLLGCGGLGQHAGRLKPRYVVQLMLPPLKPDYSTFFYSPYPLNQVSPAAFRPWQTVTFTGSSWPDYFSAHTARSLAQQLVTDTDRASGLRIQFGEHAKYAQLVQTIDYFNSIGVKRYWLDLQHPPTTLYAFSVRQWNVNLLD